MKAYDVDFGMALICNGGMMLWHLLTSSLLSFCLKAFSLFFLWPLLHNAQTKIEIVYMREHTCDTRYDTNMIWYVCNVYGVDH